MISFEYNYKNIITLNTPQYIFAANTAELLEQPRNLSAVAQLASSTYGIHLGYFASMWMRFILSCMGIIGCVMLIAGALLWQKKRIKAQNYFSYKLVQQLNFFTFLGLPLASAAYLFAGRILPATFESRSSYEVATFFMIWILSLLFSLTLSVRKAILSLLIITALVLLMIPISSFITVPEASLLNSTVHGQWWLAGADLAFLLLALAYIAAILFYLKKFKVSGEIK